MQRREFISLLALAKIEISKVDSKDPAINLGEREAPVKLGAKYNKKNSQGRPIGHTIETATKDKILIACNPDFSTVSSAPLEMTKRIRAQYSNSGASSTLWF